MLQPYGEMPEEAEEEAEEAVALCPLSHRLFLLQQHLQLSQSMTQCADTFV